MHPSALLTQPTDAGTAARWFALASIFGVAALLGALLPFQGQLALAAVALLLVAGASLLSIGITSPALGLAALVVVAVALPLELSLGPSRLNASVAVAAMVIAMWLLRQFVGSRRLALDASGLAVSALVFVLAAALSFVVGQFPWFRLPGAPMRAQLGGLMLFVLSGGVLLAVGHEVKSMARLERLTWLFVLAGGVAVVGMLIPGTDLSVGRIAVVTTTSVGCMFFTWLVAVCAGQGLCNDRLSLPKRSLLLAVTALALFRGLFVTYTWVSGWLPPLIALGTVLLLRFPRATIGGSMLVSAPALLASGRFWDTLMATESYSWATRFEAWRVMGRVIARNPLFGLGPSNYHFYTPLFPFLGYPARFNSHNNYIDLVAQTGVIGLLAFCWVSFEAFRLALRLRTRLPDGFGRAYAVSALAGLVASLFAAILADWIVPFVYNIGFVGFRSSVLFWFFLGGLLALDRITRERPRPYPAPGHLRGRPAASRA